MNRIWQYLTEITVQGNVTAILTTHYIEEARQANTVGLIIFCDEKNVQSLRYLLCDMVKFWKQVHRMIYY